MHPLPRSCPGPRIARETGLSCCSSFLMNDIHFGIAETKSCTTLMVIGLVDRKVTSIRQNIRSQRPSTLILTVCEPTESTYRFSGDAVQPLRESLGFVLNPDGLKHVGIVDYMERKRFNAGVPKCAKSERTEQCVEVPANGAVAKSSFIVTGSDDDERAAPRQSTIPVRPGHSGVRI